MTLQIGLLGSRVVTLVARVAGGVVAPEHEHVRPFERGHVDRGDTVPDCIFEPAFIPRRRLELTIAEFLPGPHLHVMVGQQIAVSAKAHEVAGPEIHGAIDEDVQTFTHRSG